MSNVSFNDQQQRQQIVMRSFTSENCIHFTVVDEIGSKGDKIDGREPLPSVRNMRDFFMSLYINGLTCHSD